MNPPPMGGGGCPTKPPPIGGGGWPICPGGGGPPYIPYIPALAMGGGAFIGGPDGLGAGAGAGGPMVRTGSEDLGGAPGIAARKSSAN